VKTITINTVQGIGDIFWCYQKLAPHVERVNINVLCLDFDALQQRARDFCRMLPKVGGVSYSQVSDAAYRRVVRMQARLAELLALPDGSIVDYAVNAPLERGVKLREIDPGFAVQEFVDLGIEPPQHLSDYLCAFVSGTQNDLCWSPGEWVAAIRQLAAKIGTDQVLLIGAQWDAPVQSFIEGELRARLRVANYTGLLSLADSIRIIRGAKFFFGFQSGLNVIADNYDVRQLMLYYESLKPMMFAWCKEQNADARIYRAATFRDSFAKTLASM